MVLHILIFKFFDRRREDKRIRIYVYRY
jgi:hypothetical protein